MLCRLAVRLGAVQQHPWQHTCANFCTDMHYWITVKQRAKTRVKHQAARGAQWLWDMQAAPAEPLPQPPWRELKGNSSQPWLVACLTVWGQKKANISLMQAVFDSLLTCRKSSDFSWKSLSLCSATLGKTTAHLLHLCNQDCLNAPEKEKVAPLAGNFTWCQYQTFQKHSLEAKSLWSSSSLGSNCTNNIARFWPYLPGF